MQDRRVAVAAGEIAVAADTGYGLRVTDLRPLGGEFDQTFAASTECGERFVVKIYRAEDIEGVRWQHQLMDRLAGTVPVPAVVRTRSGQDVSALDGDRWFGVYSWIEGALLAELDRHPRELLVDWGVTAAKIVVGVAGMHATGAPPATHMWDLRAAPDAIAAALPRLVDPAHRQLNVEAITVFADVIAPRIADLPKAVVHQDLNDFNVLANASGTRIGGIIDFADALDTVRVAEPAIAGAYAMLRKDDPIAALAAVTAGFNQVLPLTDAELALIYPLAVVRLTVNAATWTARRDDPTRKYGLARSQHTWQALAQLRRIPLDAAEARIRGAVGVDPTVVKGPHPQ
ncbi:hypothetical protein B1R94_04130 [Mycolicibacterium litorale]|nr:hypothetical protein B1R94_04130 [Mycolicibacterium litorale]